MHVGSCVARHRFGLAALLVVAAVGLVASTAAGSPAAGSGGGPPPGGYITDFVKYVGGKPGKADPSLSPVKIGWVSNQGGSIASIGPQATAAAEFAVKWINRFAGGIGGHPLQLDKCLIPNAEEEGLQCAQKFLNDPNLHVISYGAVSVGAETIDATVAGKKPIIFGFSFSPSDLVTKNLFVLGPAGPFAVYSFGSFGREFLHAKTAALIHPQTAAWGPNAAAIKLALESAGIKVKVVPFNPSSSDLLGALTAAGAQSADMVTPMVNSPANCVSAAKGIKQLGIDPEKVVWFTLCAQPSLLKPFGGDYPKYYSGISQSGDALANTPTGAAFKKALVAFGLGANINDPWYSGMFGQIMTIAQFMNSIGVDNLSPARIAAKAKAFKGPQLLGGPVIQCGKYPTAPASCGDGNYFFKYEGKGKWSRVTGWLQPPVELQKKLKARPSK